MNERFAFRSKPKGYLIRFLRFVLFCSCVVFFISKVQLQDQELQSDYWQLAYRNAVQIANNDSLLLERHLATFEHDPRWYPELHNPAPEIRRIHLAIEAVELQSAAKAKFAYITKACTTENGQLSRDALRSYLVAEGANLFGRMDEHMAWLRMNAAQSGRAFADDTAGLQPLVSQPVAAGAYDHLVDSTLAMSTSDMLAFLQSIQMRYIIGAGRVMRLWLAHGTRGWLSWDSVVVVAVPEKELVLPGERFAARIICGVPYRSRSISPYVQFSNAWIDVESHGIVLMHARVASAGNHVMQGIAKVDMGGFIGEDSVKLHFRAFRHPSAFIQTNAPALLYSEVPNLIHMRASADYECSSLRLVVSGAKVTRLNDSCYEVHISPEIKEGRALLIAHARRSTDTIAALPFRVVNPPALRPELPHRLSVEALQRISELSLHTDDASEARILSYTIQLFPADDRPDQLLKIAGADLAANPEVANMLLLARTGDRLLISELVVRTPYGRRLQAGTHTVAVTE